MFGLSGEQVVEIVKTLPALLLALASFVAAIKATRRANAAEASAAAAHEKATEATREQLTFALKRAVRDAKEQGVSVVVPTIDSFPPHPEGGTQQ